MEISGKEVHEKFIGKYYKELDNYNHIFNNVVDLSNDIYTTVNPNKLTLRYEKNRTRYHMIVEKYGLLSEFEQKRFRLILTKLLIKCGIENPRDYFDVDFDYFDFITISLLDKDSISIGQGSPEMFDILNAMYQENFMTIIK